MSEARAIFLATLRAGLRGLPASAIDDIVGEYAAHFDEGANANRTDEAITQALGDPLALADELRVELQIEQWEQTRTTASAISTVMRILGFGVVSATLVFLLGPVLLLLAACMIIVIAALLCAGVWLAFVGSSLELPGGMPTTLLASVGSISAAISLASFLALGAIALVNALARYARLQYKHLPHTNRQGSKS